MNTINQQSLVVNRRGLRVSSSHAAARVKPARVLVFFLLHIPLGILMSRSPAIATLHAFASLTGGLWWALWGKSLDRVACVGAYIVGSEILWRMTGAGIFWETGKYAITVIFIVALLRHQRFKPKMMTLVYLGLLLPSALLAIVKLGLLEARNPISFYLSGHLALIVSVWFFSKVTLTRSKLQQLLMSSIGPILGIASISMFGIVNAASIRFSDNSNIATSGGFGPNQVSAVLGLGALLAFLYNLDSQVNYKMRVVVFGIMVLLATQSAMTFSRGGLYNAGGAAILASVFFVKDAQARFKLLAVTVLVVLIGNFIIVPALNQFTGGALVTRFQDTEPTGRVPLVISDLNIWSDNFILGAGLGESKGLRDDLVRSSIGHTEFSRLLAEQGIFGFMMILLLLWTAIRNLARARTPRSKALVAALLCWSFLFMLNAAMRLVAPSFIVGLAFATILSRDREHLPQLKMWLRSRSTSFFPNARIPIRQNMEFDH